MKIGILTFWWSADNYGQLLQCYALQKYLRDAGHDAFLIKYSTLKDIPPNKLYKCIVKAFNPVKLFRFLYCKVTTRAAIAEQNANPRYFNDFRERYIKQSVTEYSSFAQLKTNPPVAEAYIVGSDQVWNFGSIPLWQAKNVLHSYFLDFGLKSTKRLSYAASWGKCALANEYKSEIEPLLTRFNYVSVREQSGVQLCKDCGYRSAQWVCDPTLLLSAATYRNLYKENKVRKIDSKYLLLYMLNNECNFNIQKVYDFAAAKGLQVVYVTGNNLVDHYKKYFATITEWLYLVDNAEYVITNSFHCGVFSTIFAKTFGIIPLKGKHEGMNARFDSLFALRGTGNRFIKDSDFSVLDAPYTALDVPSPYEFLQALN